MKTTYCTGSVILNSYIGFVVVTKKLRKLQGVHLENVWLLILKQFFCTFNFKCRLDVLHCANIFSDNLYHA